jgi:NAD+ kinase
MSVIVIGKQTFYERYLQNKHVSIEKKSPLYRRMLRTHESQLRTMDQCQSVLSKLGIRADFERGLHHGEIKAELVITIGGDGTLLLASHRIGPQTRLLGINGAPETSVGYFCAGSKKDAKDCIIRALENTLAITTLERMQVSVSKHVLSRRVLNEVLFCHRSPAATTRYVLKCARKSEEQRSSGVWIGPAAGSTAAQRSAGGRTLSLSSTDLQFVVREPYMSEHRDGRPTMLIGLVPSGQSLEIRSTIAQGCLYLDGHETEYGVPLGSTIQFERSAEPLRVLGLTRRVTRRS